MTTPVPRPPRRPSWHLGGWIVLIAIAVFCWCCGFGSAVITLIGG